MHRLDFAVHFATVTIIYLMDVFYRHVNTVEVVV